MVRLHQVPLDKILRMKSNMKFESISSNWYGLMKFCDEVNLQVVPAIDISNDVAELCDVIDQIKEYLDLFVGFK